MPKVIEPVNTLNRQNNQGFTIIELLVAMGVAGILLAFAVPSYDNLTKNSRLVSNTNLVVGAYNLARSEAVARGTNVVVKNIAKGWQVAQVAPAEVIKNFEPNRTGLTFTPTTFPDVTFSSSGFRPFNDNAVVKIKLCDSRGKGREITVSPAGMTKVDGEPSC